MQNQKQKKHKIINANLANIVMVNLVSVINLSLTSVNRKTISIFDYQILYRLCLSSKFNIKFNSVQNIKT